ncbi:PilN domain-containing protein [Oceanobacillus chungangensis]|uniref:Fimbrial assembly protein n=1 Tax=Oceanobacillus chungangensis TaxID=1229152 RepID=A0A3D8Q1T3_9BACI|nr:hypothetical protein [Oceanobacillus chungangensis]RDW21568.1 hypothetical protein CWR45_01455 [Oceanobacillus chungangensis]
MKPEVNLLPKYERYNNVPFILFFIGLIICLLLGGSLIYFYVTTNAELTEAEANVSQLTEEKTLLEARVNALNTSDSSTLEGAITYAEQYVVPTSKLIEEFMVLLPENSYLSDLNYDFETVQIETQFETITDSADYVEALTNSAYMENVVINQVETFEHETGEADDEIKDQYNIIPRYHAYYSLEVNKSELVKEEDTDE